MPRDITHQISMSIFQSFYNTTRQCFVTNGETNLNLHHINSTTDLHANATLAWSSIDVFRASRLQWRQMRAQQRVVDLMPAKIRHQRCVARVQPHRRRHATAAATIVVVHRRNGARCLTRLYLRRGVTQVPEFGAVVFAVAKEISTVATRRHTRHTALMTDECTHTASSCVQRSFFFLWLIAKKTFRIFVF